MSARFHPYLCGRNAAEWLIYMKKIFCCAVIALIGVIYSIALMVMATINNVYSGDAVPGLWGLIRGYGAVRPLILSLVIVAVGIAVCIWGMLEKKK